LKRSDASEDADDGDEAEEDFLDHEGAVVV
jgi:hypothetical protein